MKILCPVSLGELVDKISILRIKEKFITDSEKLRLVNHEHTVLLAELDRLALSGIDGHLASLQEVNEKLWKIEDDIRELEREKRFDQDFIELARAVYVTNDERFRRKAAVNDEYGSEVKEVKSYEKYD